jgi:hypothetical protein
MQFLLGKPEQKIDTCANPNKRNFEENSILLILNKDRAASFIHFR